MEVAELNANTAIATAPSDPDAHDAAAAPDADHGPTSPPHDGEGTRRTLRHPIKGEAKPGGPAQPAVDHAVAAPEPVARPEPEKDTHKRSDFVRETGVDSPETSWSPELTQQYRTLLENHITNLTDPDGRPLKILDDPKFAADRALVEDLTTNGRIDSEKISKYLKTPKGKISANMVLENKTRLMLQGLALEVIAHGSPQAGAKDILERELNDLKGTPDTLRGKLASSALVGGVTATGAVIWEKILEYGIVDLARTVGGTVAHDVASVLANHHTLSAGLLGGAVGVGGNLLSRRSEHRPTGGKEPKTELQEYISGLKTLQADDAMKEYLFRVAGISVDDFKITNVGDPILNPDGSPMIDPKTGVPVVETTASVKFKDPAERKTVGTVKLLRDATGMLDTRKEFYKTLGWPDEAIDSKGRAPRARHKKRDKPEKKTGNDLLFMRPNDENWYQLATVWNGEIDEELDKLQAADPGGDRDAQYTVARAAVAMRYHERALEEAGIDTSDHSKSFKNIEEGIYKLEGSTQENRTKAEDELGRIETDTSLLSRELQFTLAVAAARKEYANEVDEFQTKYAGEVDLNSAITSRRARFTEDATGKTYYQLQQESETSKYHVRIDRLRTGDLRDTIEDRVRERIQDEHDRQVGLPGRKGPLSGPAEVDAQIRRAVDEEIKVEEQRLKERYDDTITQLNQRKRDDETQIADLITYRRTFETLSEVLVDASMQELVRDSEIETHYAEITAAGGVDLTKSVDQLIDGKTSPAAREKLVHARIEHLRQDLVRAAGLTPPDITGMTPDRAAAALDLHQQLMAPLTRQAYERVNQELKRQTKELTEKARTGELSDDDKTKVENTRIVVRVGKNRNEIANRSRAIDLTKLTDNRKLSTLSDTEKDEYSENEKAQDVPVAYHTTMNMLFDYEGGQEINGKKYSRNEYFGKIAELLPPQDLARLINESGIIGNVRAPVTMDRVANLMHAAYSSGGFTQVEIRRLNRFIIDRLVKKTSATF